MEFAVMIGLDQCYYYSFDPMDRWCMIPILQLTSQYNVIGSLGNLIVTRFRLLFICRAIFFFFFLQFVLPEESLSQLTHRIAIRFPLIQLWGKSPEIQSTHPRLILMESNRL